MISVCLCSCLLGSLRLYMWFEGLCANKITYQIAYACLASIALYHCSCCCPLKRFPRAPAWYLESFGFSFRPSFRTAICLGWSGFEREWKIVRKTMQTQRFGKMIFSMINRDLLINIHIFGLANAIDPIECLRFQLWIPMWVEQEQMVGTS